MESNEKEVSGFDPEAHVDEQTLKANEATAPPTKEDEETYEPEMAASLATQIPPKRESIRPALVNDFDFGEEKAAKAKWRGSYNTFPMALVSVKVVNKIAEIKLTADLYHEPFTVERCSVLDDDGLKGSVSAFLDKDVDFSEILGLYHIVLIKKREEKRAAEQAEKEKLFDTRYQYLQTVLNNLSGILPEGMTVEHSTTKEEFLKNNWRQMGLTIFYRGKDFSVSVSDSGEFSVRDLEYHDRNYKHAKSMVTKIQEWVDVYHKGQTYLKERAARIAETEVALSKLLGKKVKVTREDTPWAYRFEPTPGTYDWVEFRYSLDRTGDTPFGFWNIQLTQEDFLTIVNIIVKAAEAKR